MSYWRFMAILRILAGAETGLTVGKLQQHIPAMTRYQLEKCLKHMVREGDVMMEKVAYRPNIDKNVYHLSDRVVGKLRGIIETYEARRHKIGLF